MEEVDNYLQIMKAFNDSIISFIDSQNDDKSALEEISKLIEESKIVEDSLMFKSLFHLIINIFSNYHYPPSSFSKIQDILLPIKDDITRLLPNDTIINIVKSHKRILLFFIENKIINMNDSISCSITDVKCINNDYDCYFGPELIGHKFRTMHKSDLFLLKKKDFRNIEDEMKNNFFQKRREGQNDSYICSLIRDDDIDEFIKYVNMNNCTLDVKIEDSIYETNKYLTRNKPNLIEYAAFFGSIKIVKYLIKNNVKITDSFWDYAIHSNIPDIIHLAEEYAPNLNENKCISLIKKLIKYHHNDIAEYFLNNYYVQNKDLMPFDSKIVKYFNYYFINKDTINNRFFIFLCKYDHSKLVSLLIKNKDIDVNFKII